MKSAKRLLVLIMCATLCTGLSATALAAEPTDAQDTSNQDTVAGGIHSETILSYANENADTHTAVQSGSSTDTITTADGSGDSDQSASTDQLYSDTSASNSPADDSPSIPGSAADSDSSASSNQTDSKSADSAGLATNQSAVSVDRADSMATGFSGQADNNEAASGEADGNNTIFNETSAASSSATGTDGTDAVLSVSSSDWYLSDDTITVSYEGGYSYDGSFYVCNNASSIKSVTSSNEKVVIAEEGYYDTIYLYWKGAGTAKVTVTLEDGTQKSCTVTCEPLYWSLSDTAITLPAGTSTYYLYTYDCKAVSVTSSNNAVVTASIESSYSDESTILLTKKGSGTATITVTGIDGSKKTCQVTAVYSALKLDKSKVVFNKKNPYNSDYLYLTKDYNDKEWSIKKVTSSNKKVAKVSLSDYYVVITPIKKGKTTVTVTDTLGRTLKIPVTVGKDWAAANLKIYTSAYLGYSTKKMTVYSKPGAKVTVKLKGKTYKKKIGKKGYTTIKVKDRYKVKTPFTVKATYKKKTATYKGKISADAWASRGTIWSCQYTIPVKAYHVTKGDTIILTVGGNTYKKKVTANADSAEYVFSTPYQNRNYSMMTIKIKNKYKQTLYNNTSYIRW